MPPNGRRSIQKTASVSGTGLHTGAETVATFLPATAGQGIRFRRVDLTGKPEIPARLTEVEATGTPRSTPSSTCSRPSRRMRSTTSSSS